VPIALQTQHHANLFGVAFLPQHNNSRIISGAMDYTVQLHELDAGAFNIQPKYRSSSSSSGGSNGARTGMRRHPPAPQLHQVVPRTSVFHCHKSRVKVGVNFSEFCWQFSLCT
jgi:WD and tetratricopeptide repeat-containing protein 1